MVQLVAKAHGRAVIIAGDTKPLKETLKSLGGKWAGSCGGWMWPGSKKTTVIEALCKAGHSVDDQCAAAASDGGGDASAGAASSTKAAEPKAQAKRVSRAAADEAIAASIGAAIDEACGEALAKKQRSSDGQEEEAWFTVLGGDGSKRKATVGTFDGGEPAVDIREFFSKDGSDLPGKKGIRLKLAEWESLKAAMPSIDAQLKKLKS